MWQLVHNSWGRMGVNPIADARERDAHSLALTKRWQLVRKKKVDFHKKILTYTDVHRSDRGSATAIQCILYFNTILQ